VLPCTYAAESSITRPVKKQPVLTKCIVNFGVEYIFCVVFHIEILIFRTIETRVTSLRSLGYGFAENYIAE
jgi:hypothetical protein